MAGRTVSLFALCLGCLGFSAWGLARAELTPVYGADSCCEDCTEEDPLIINECRHLADADPCQTDKCTRNVIFRAYCTKIAEGVDCNLKAPAPGTWVTQERRLKDNCTTDNPTTWNPHSPGECEWFHYNETRCETDTCDGDEWATPLTRTDDIRRCN